MAGAERRGDVEAQLGIAERLDDVAVRFARYGAFEKLGVLAIGEEDEGNAHDAADAASGLDAVYGPGEGQIHQGEVGNDPFRSCDGFHSRRDRRADAERHARQACAQLGESLVVCCQENLRRHA